MLSTVEIARSANGAWALFRGDARGMRAFDQSVEGFWRSFGVILLLLPAIGIITASERISLLDQTPFTPETFPSAAFVWSRLIAQGLGFIATPILLAVFSRPLGLEKRYVPLVVAFNWSELVAAIPVTIPALLHVLGIIGDEATLLLELIAFGIVLRYRFVVARAATGGPTGFCVGLVALDQLATIFVAVAVSAFAGI
jgi:hypothetical protein